MDITKLKPKDRDIISRCFLFDGITENELADILSDGFCELVSYSKGEIIFDAEHYLHSIGLVLSGSVSVSKLTCSRRYHMNVISCGEMFGAAALFSDAPYVTELSARSPCRILFFPQQLMERLIREYPAAALNYIRFLSGRVRFLNSKIQNLIPASTCQSVAQYLARNAREHDGQLTVDPAGGAKSIAEQLNIGRTSLYRALNLLESQNVIKRSGKTIEILDLAALLESR